MFHVGINLICHLGTVESLYTVPSGGIQIKETSQIETGKFLDWTKLLNKFN